MVVKSTVALPVLLMIVVGCASGPFPPSSETEWLRGFGNVPAAPKACSTTQNKLQKTQLEKARFEERAPVGSDPSPSIDDVKMGHWEEKANSGPLSLNDLETIAFQHNPTLSMAAARIESAQGQKVQSGLCPNPTIGYHATEVGANGTSGAQGGFVRQRIITAGKLGLSESAAEREVAATHFEFHAQEQRVLNDVRMRFYEALVAQRRVEVVEELVKIGENLVNATQTLLQEGQVPENDLLQAEIRAEEARILYENARNERLEAWRRLAAVIGQPQLPPSALEGTIETELPTFTWDDCYGQVLASHPEVNAARSRVERTLIAIKRAKREPIPNVDVFVSVRHLDMTDDEIANILAEVPLPIFNRNQGNIRTAEAEWIAARNEVHRVELDLQDRFAMTFRQYANAKQQAERYAQTIIPRAKRSLKLVTEGYEKGQVEYLTLLTGQETYLRAELAHLNAQEEAIIATTLLEGQLLSGSLSTPR